MTLFTVLDTLNKISAPFVPFMTEAVYQNIVRAVDASAPESVHMCAFPKMDESFVDADLEANMEKVLEIVVGGRAARNLASMKNRQPLAAMYVQGDPMPAGYAAIVAEELNVNEVKFVEDASSLISYRVKPQLKTLGPRYGKVLPAINAYLAQDGVGDKVVETLNSGKAFEAEIGGIPVILEREDVLIETVQKEGFVSNSDSGVTVVLDTRLTPALIEEGFVREIVSKVQTMRKEADFEVTDHIFITYAADAKVTGIFTAHGSEIASDTLADGITAAAPAGYVKEWDINGEKVTLGVQKA